MPMSMLMLKCWCRDFQITKTKLSLKILSKRAVKYKKQKYYATKTKQENLLEEVWINFLYNFDHIITIYLLNNNINTVFDCDHIDVILFNSL